MKDLELLEQNLLTICTSIEDISYKEFNDNLSMILIGISEDKKTQLDNFVAEFFGKSFKWLKPEEFYNNNFKGVSTSNLDAPGF